MSELIDNRRHRLDALKDMITRLHGGADPAELKNRFRAVLDNVGPSEISALETELMAEGMPETEIRRMCELHVAAFRDSLERAPRADAVPGHPVDTFRRDNEAIVRVVAAYREFVTEFSGALAGELADPLAANRIDAAAVARWRDLHGQIERVAAHYARKEYLVFPFLEKAGITAPPKVMWSIDEAIREQIKAATAAAGDADELGVADARLIVEVVLLPMLDAIAAMVEKEDRVLWPMALEQLADSDWGSVAEQWAGFPPGLVEPESGWAPPAAALPPPVAAVGNGEVLALGAGHLTATQLVAMLNTLPLDLTFVDADDRVAYFSEGPDRIFARNRAIIGRRVADCHPPSSMHIVERLIADLRAGRREVAEFWIRLGERFVHIRYFAVRDGAGAYLGCLEMTQDVAAIRALAGERRLLDEPAAGGTQ